MSVTKTPRAVVEGNPPSPTHQVNNAELRILLDEMRVETAAAIAARNQLAAVACATTANITLSGEQTIDGVTTSASRVLVKNQTTTANNGIYVSAAGAWARATDANTSEEVALAFVYVLGGTVAAGKTYQILNSPTLGTDAITWTLVGYEADLAAMQASLGALAAQDTIIASQIIDATAAGQSVLTAANAAAQRTALGLAIGTDVQAYDAELAAIAGLTSAADRVPYFTGSGAAALATFTSAGRALVDDADAAAQRATLGASAAGSAVFTAANAAAQRTALGLEIGTDVQAYDADLAALAALTAPATKLAGIATGATANSSDATLLARANHTGTQAISTVTGLQTALDGKLAAEFATEAQVIQGLDEDLPVNSAGVYAALADSERRMSDDLQTRLPAAMTDGVTSPGISPERYCVASEGAPGYLPPVAFPLVVGSSEKGRVLEWNGSGSLATDDEAAARLSPVGVMALASGRIWRVRAVYRRGTETADPSGDAVRVSIQWLGADFTTASLTTAETDIVVQTALSPSDGWQTITAVLAQADATGVDHFNTQAVYARVFIEQQGNSSYDDGALITVAELVQEDITFAEVVTDVAAGIDARVTVLENRDVFATETLADGTDLHALTDPGDFTVMNAVNGPTMAGVTIGGTFRERNSVTAHALVWDLSASKEGMYWANKVSGTWGNWQEAASVEYVDGEIQALADDIAAMATSYSARNSAYTVVSGDRGKVIEVTSGTWTLSLTAAATLGSGFSVIIANTSSGTITIDPNSAELIDGAATFTLGPYRMIMLVCTGTAWKTIAFAGYVTTSSLDTTAGRLVKTGDFGLGTAISLTASDDLNALVTSGLFYNPTAGNTTGNNYPITSAGALTVVARSATNVVQKFVSYGGSSTAAGVREFTRSYGTSGWSPWVELFHQGSVLGTVSESSGVPTGKVIERGSNANGEYVRFADGTQICTVTATAVEATTAVGSIYMHVDALTWTFPATFTGTPVVSGGAGVVSRWLGIGTPGTTSVAYRVYSHSTSATTSTPVMTATGRWF